MRLLSEDLKLSDKYNLIDDNSLSFMDKVFSLYDNETIEDYYRNDIPLFKHSELDHFKSMMKEIKENNLKVIIVSDYDSDGVLALVIFSRLLDYLKINYKYYIPSRIKEGYGLNDMIVDKVIRYGFDVLITIDNGLTAINELNELYNHQIKTIVIDHHEYNHRPNVDILLHPLLFDKYYHHMCSGSLCLMIQNEYFDDDYSKTLAMITTLSDIMRIYGINRKILKEGIILLNEKRYLPLINLDSREKYTHEDLIYGIIPKINAISRMDHMTNVNILVKYFMDLKNDNHETAMQINKINDLRKELSNKMCEDGLKMINDDNKINIIYDEHFYDGLCGIVASKIVSKTNKPAIVLAFNNGLYKGSARSVDTVDLYHHLKDFKKFNSFGGHKKAVGMSIKYEDMSSFIEYINNKNFEYDIIKEPLIKIDFEDLTIDNIKALESLKPFGEGFKEPLFYIENPKVKSIFMIKKIYPKYTLENNIEAIAFDSRLKADNFIGFIGTLSINNYRNLNKINIGIKEIVL